MTNRVLIAGASGRFGSHAALEFEKAGWEIRNFDREREKLADAAMGCDVIVNALSPQNYHNWENEVPRITREMIAAGTASGATILVPGNVYNFGISTAPWSETTPHSPNTSKGKIRAEMEQAYKASGVQTIILRAGDFIDTRPSGNFFDLVIIKKLAKGILECPGALDAKHTWAFLPDLARAAVGLAEMRDELARFEDVPYPGYSISAHEMADALSPTPRVKKMAWWPIRIASIVWPLGRALLEMRYLWDHPHSLDGARFEQLMPEFQATPLTQALALATDFNPD